MDDSVRPSHRARWIAITVLVVAAGLTAVLADSPPATLAMVQSAIVGHPAPRITGETIDGKSFSLPKAPGKYVVLNFFASWCVPCQSEAPALVQFQFQHQTTGDATVVSVVFNDTESAAANFQNHVIGASWPTLVDANGSLALAYGVVGQPTTFIIAPDGFVVAHIVSPVTSAELNALISKAKAEGA